MDFDATLELDGTTATGITAPIEDAKSADTRQRRVERSVEALTARRKRP